ncbi:MULTISPECIES: bifunctional DNA primase/polymerase [Streptomyces]|uniref:bifunctional DNA primase/polymerase n=1 Tax=Streptomyces TaxID=1883 RepID=UPI0015C472EA|nr:MULTISPECIES: bifunctional DNA primase/polymerase [Streptomyces]MBK0376847.1 bifunctional DNA primase/polymerase [Streptomyces sp. RB110-1]MBK0386779.1 bifunctional DNA primase/polymerase [Streptomyces sp. RB110-2]MCF3171090.1 bifunctional DNA primase/polymerase [Streptomyces violaceoruber]MDW4902751.1 bifunctional DNA primase/polymerase [Streptomyces californicus]QLG34361.1 bifunctional DNA primase/polymerase [Streptomyces sp. CB04723]
MSAWLKDETTLHTGAAPHHGVGLFALLRDQPGSQAAQVTAAGAAWLAGATPYPRSTLAQWEERPTAPGVLPCGTAFDVVNVPALFGRRMLERLWAEGPGSGPVATHRGRMLLFAAPGTAQRLPSLLSWEEWGTDGSGGAGGAGEERGTMPPLLCHGTGDAVTVPPLTCTSSDGGPRWLVAPDTRTPWLPGPDVLLWACVRVSRTPLPRAGAQTIFPPADQGANVYDVTRRR